MMERPNKEIEFLPIWRVRIIDSEGVHIYGPFHTISEALAHLKDMENSIYLTDINKIEIYLV